MHEEPRKNIAQKPSSKFLKNLLYCLIALALIFWILAGYEMEELNLAYQNTYPAPRPTYAHHIFSHLFDHASSTPTTPSSIEPWMTFEYLNVVFKLPPSYLSEKMNITDPRYPHLSINRLSSDEKVDTAALADQVKALVKSYATGTSTPSKPTNK